MGQNHVIERVPGVLQWGSWRGKEVELRIWIENLRTWKSGGTSGWRVRESGLWEGGQASRKWGTRRYWGKGVVIQMEVGWGRSFWKVRRGERKDEESTIESHKKEGFICCAIHGMTWPTFSSLLSEPSLVLQQCRGTITAQSTLNSTAPLACKRY